MLCVLVTLRVSTKSSVTSESQKQLKSCNRIIPIFKHALSETAAIVGLKSHNTVNQHLLQQQIMAIKLLNKRTVSTFDETTMAVDKTRL